jgi:hypothetical protein
LSKTNTTIFPHIFSGMENFEAFWESGAGFCSVLALKSDLTLQFLATHILPLRSDS